MTEFSSPEPLPTLTPGTLYKYRQHRRSLPNRECPTFKMLVDIRGTLVENAPFVVLPNGALCMYIKTITKTLIWSTTRKTINNEDVDMVEYKEVDRFLFLYENHIIEFTTDAVRPSESFLFGSSVYYSSALEQKQVLENPPLLTPIYKKKSKL